MIKVKINFIKLFLIKDIINIVENKVPPIFKKKSILSDVKKRLYILYIEKPINKS